MGTRGSKRRRAPSGGGCQVERQRPPPEHPEAPTLARIGEGTRDAIQHPFRGEDGCSQGYCGGWSRGDSELNESAKASVRTPGTAEDGGSRRHINASMVPLGLLEEGPSVDSGSMNTSGSSGQTNTARLSQILPVRSAPLSWRPLAATSASGVLSRNGNKKPPQSNEKTLLQQSTRKKKTLDAIASVPNGVEATGNSVADGSECARSNANGNVGDARASHGDHVGKSPGLPAASRQGYPGIADTCGGIRLRLTPGERSLEPWDSTLAPLRAMCDVDPSLSRAGIEHRVAVHGVEGAQELKSHYKVKVSDDVSNAARSPSKHPVLSSPTPCGPAAALLTPVTLA